MNYYNPRGVYERCIHGNGCRGYQIPGGYGMCKYAHPDGNIHGDPKITISKFLTDKERMKKYIEQLHKEIDKLKYLNARFSTIIKSYENMNNYSRQSRANAEPSRPRIQYRDE